VISKHKAIKNTKRKRKCPKIKKILEKNPTVIWCLQIMAEPPRHGKAMSNVREGPPKNPQKIKCYFFTGPRKK